MEFIGVGAGTAEVPRRKAEVCGTEVFWLRFTEPGNGDTEALARSRRRKKFKGFSGATFEVADCDLKAGLSQL